MTEEFDPEIHDEYDPARHSFHVDAHPKAKQPTIDRNTGMWGQCVSDSNQTDERCGGTAKGPHGKCHWHGGSTPTKDKNPDQGAPEGNTNAEGHEGVNTFEDGNAAAMTHGAFSEHLLSDLTDDEIASMSQLSELLGDPESAKEAGILIATEAYIKYKRSADERFLRRFESLCDTFGIVLAEVMEHLHAHEHRHEHDHDHSLTDRQRADLDAITGGSGEIDVQVVGDADDDSVDGNDETTIQIGDW